MTVRQFDVQPRRLRHNDDCTSLWRGRPACACLCLLNGVALSPCAFPTQAGRSSFDLRRLVCSVIVAILVGGSIAVSCAEEKVVPVYEEPLHRMVFEREPVRVLDVQLRPGDTSLYHLHEDPIFYIALEISEIDAQIRSEEWKRTRVSEWHPGAVAHDVGHAEKPLIHRIRNVGGETFRLIAVTNAGPPAPLDGLEADAPLPGEVETDVEWFRQSRVTLTPDSGSEHFRSPFPIVVVQVSPGRTELAVAEAFSRHLTGPGGFAYVEPDRGTELRNSGDVPVTLVVIEAR